MRKRNLTALPSKQRKAGNGFTLIEVLVAVAIFSIAATALMITFRTSTNAFRTGRRSAATMQALRFTAETLGSDLRSVYYETAYLARQQRLRQRFYSQENQLLNIWEKESQRAAAVGDEPGFLGVIENLRFVGDKNSVEFAHFVPSDGTHKGSEWGVERVRFFLAGPDGTDLYRQRRSPKVVIRINPNIEEELKNTLRRRGDLKMTGPTGFPEQDAMLSGLNFQALGMRGGQLPGQFQQYADQFQAEYFVLEHAEPDEPELIAENVAVFELSYGHYSGDWAEAASWDSDEKANRSPEFNVPFDDPNFRQKLEAYQRKPLDQLPGFVRLKMGIADPTAEGSKKDKAKVKSVETTVWMPAALELFVPQEQDYYGAMGMNGGTY